MTTQTQMQTQTQTQTAAWLDHPHHGATLNIRHDIPIPSPSDGQVLIKLEVTGFCHSDVHSIYGETPMSTNIAGHEGVGRIVAVGKGVDEEMMGRLAGVKWLYSACGECETCERWYPHCPKQSNSGRNVPGTFQQYVVSPIKYTTIIPESLNPELVAPLLCAGLTMYSAVSKIDRFKRPGDWVVIMGAGGGLGHLGVQIAAANRYRVIAIDSTDKQDLCQACGASEFIDFTRGNDDFVETQVRRITDGVGAHAIIVTAGSERAYEQAPRLLRNLGLMVCVGLPRRGFMTPVSPFDICVRGLTVVGTSVGTEDEMTRLLDLAGRGLVNPHVRVFEGFGDINRVMGMLERFEVQGRVVLRVPK